MRQSSDACFRPLDGQLPGTFVLTFPEKARGKFATAPEEIAQLVLDAVDGLAVGETIPLHSDTLAFDMQLHCRHKDHSRLVLVTEIGGDPIERRDERIRRAFEDKCPKLATWSTDGYTSVLVLQSDDIQNSNVGIIFQTVKRALAERADPPAIIVLVETEVTPMYGWVLKENERLRDDVPQPNGLGYYTEGGF